MNKLSLALLIYSAVFSDAVHGFKENVELLVFAIEKRVLIAWKCKIFIF